MRAIMHRIKTLSLEYKVPSGNFCRLGVIDIGELRATGRKELRMIRGDVWVKKWCRVSNLFTRWIGRSIHMGWIRSLVGQITRSPTK